MGTLWNRRAATILTKERPQDYLSAKNYDCSAPDKTIRRVEHHRCADCGAVALPAQELSCEGGRRCCMACGSRNVEKVWSILL
jgi:hypothetical protein